MNPLSGFETLELREVPNTSTVSSFVDRVSSKSRVQSWKTQIDERDVEGLSERPKTEYGGEVDVCYPERHKEGKETQRKT